MHDDYQYILDALSIGVYGYILKMATLVRLLEGIKTVSEGEQYFDSDIISKLPSVYPEGDNSETMSLASKTYGLASCEFDALILIASNYTARETTEKLCINFYTVCNHKESIYIKLEIKNGAKLVEFVIQHGFIKSGVQSLLLLSF